MFACRKKVFISTSTIFVSEELFIKMLTLKPFSSSELALGGFLIAAIGVYFVFLRPPLLPEDLKYMGTSLGQIIDTQPNLSVWLQNVFYVMGGYIFTTGILTIYVSLTSFRARASGSFVIVVVSGLSSMGVMTFVNFIIDSDFKWILLLFMFPWFLALLFYIMKK